MLDEVPITTTSATTEASAICAQIRRAPFQVDNLVPRAFLQADGSSVSGTVDFEPYHRPTGITYVTFECTVKGAEVDKRINQPPLHLVYSLKLPQTCRPSPPSGFTSHPSSATPPVGPATPTVGDVEVGMRNGTLGGYSDSKSSSDSAHGSDDGNDPGSENEGADLGNRKRDRQYGGGDDGRKDGKSRHKKRSRRKKGKKSKKGRDTVSHTNTTAGVTEEDTFGMADTNEGTHNATQDEGNAMPEDVLSDLAKRVCLRNPNVSWEEAVRRTKELFNVSTVIPATVTPAVSTKVPSSIQLQVGGSGHGASVVSASSSSAPKMAKLIELSKGGRGSHVGDYSYFGTLEFVDDQDCFDSVFGQHPIMLRVTDQSTAAASGRVTASVDSTSAAEELHAYLERCEFDAFVALCEADYVGIVDKDHEQRATQEVCKRILQLKQVFKPARSNTVTTLHPAKLFDRYLVHVSALPDDASTWSIFLCRSFYDALTIELKEKMDEDNFTFPDLTKLQTKHQQLNALREVRGAAVKSYDNLETEKRRMTALLQSRGGSQQGRGGHHTYQSTPPSASPDTSSRMQSPGRAEQYQLSPGVGTVYQFQPGNLSQAETTLQKYKGFPQRRQPGEELPTRTGADGLQYPYRPEEPEKVSDYPVGFRGCFGCGDPNHFRFKEECPYNMDPAVRNKYWTNLWIHKPHTKQHGQAGHSSGGRGGGNSNGMGHYGPSAGGQQQGYSPYSSPSQQGQPVLQHGAGNHQVPLPPLPGQGGPGGSPGSSLQPRNSNAGRGRGRGAHVNTPAWMQNENAPPGGSSGAQNSGQQPPSGTEQLQHEPEVARGDRLFVMSAPLLQHSRTHSLPPMPLNVDNGLPGIVLKFGRKGTAKLVPWTCHVDTCAAMSTGNLELHQYIISKHPELVAEYIQYDDPNAFEPIKLQCAVPDYEEYRENHGCLTAVVRYYTSYEVDGAPYILSLGLGKEVAVNCIIGLPELRALGMDIMLTRSCVASSVLKRDFPIDYTVVNPVKLDGKFDAATEFVRPPVRATMKTGTAMQFHANPPTVTDTSENGIHRRVVRLQKE